MIYLYIIIALALDAALCLLVGKFIHVGMGD